MNRHATAKDRLWRHRIGAYVAAMGLLAATGVVISPPLASASGAGTVLLEDNFMGPTVTSTEYVVGGTNGTPCLTAAGSGSSTPGRCAGASDAPGSGALRLTPATNNTSGFLLYNHPLPTKAGLDISFNMYQYGGSGADGISFFLTDGSKTLTEAGPTGGSLGYKASDTANGLADALVGVGFDAYGNFTGPWNDTSCAQQPPQIKQSIVVRGPVGANRQKGYCVLGFTGSISGGIDVPDAGGTRANSKKEVRIVIDPPNDPNPKIRVSMNGTEHLVVDEPAILKSTPTFKFGWSASTGGSTNNHEINFLKVESVQPITPKLSLSSSAATTVNSGATATVSMTASLSAADGPEHSPVDVNLSVPAGLSFNGTPSGPGWICAPPTGTSASCTYAASASNPIISGTTLPSISVPVVSSGSGNFTVNGSVSSADNSATGAQLNASTQVAVRPVAAGATATGTAHPVAPAAVPVTLAAPAGTGPFTWSVITPPSVSYGTVTMDPSTGSTVFTPTPGKSGRATFTYKVVGAGGIESLPATVTVDIAPTLAGGSATTHYGNNVVIPSSTPLGKGPFTYQLVAAPTSGSGSVTVHPSTGSATFTPAAGYSGITSFTYRVVDGDGVASAPATVSVTVRPSVAGVTASLTLDSHGNGSVVTGAPATSGVGPFTYQISTPPGSGGATIDSLTGNVTYAPASGVSGTFTTGVTVTDGSGTVSPAQPVTVTVHPYAGPVTGSTDANTEVTLPAPAVSGSGPFTYTVSPAPGTTATIASDGKITVDPNGRSGVIGFTYEAIDANGISSGPIAVSLEVAPILANVSASTVADATTPAAVPLAGVPTGTGPFTYEILSGPDSGLGTATVTPTGIEVVPVAGASGKATVRFRVVGADGIASAPATATVDIAPVASSSPVAATSGKRTEVAFPKPAGTGPFTYQIVSGINPSTDGQVTVEGDKLVITPSGSFSGHKMIMYNVTDADGITSAAQGLPVEISPASSTAQLPKTISKPGGSTPVTVTVPTPSGTGPFTYELVSPPSSLGNASIDPVTGAVTFTPKDGVSGKVKLQYRVKDANGIYGAPSDIELDVVPAGSSAGTGGALSGPKSTDGKAVDIMAPTPVGNGPFTYRISKVPPSSQGTVSIDPSTGKMTFIPAPGFSGTAEFAYEVVDSSGLVSSPISVSVPVEAAKVVAPANPLPPVDRETGPKSPEPTGRSNGGGERRLAMTGSDASSGVLVGLMLLLAGIASVLGGRRRKRKALPTA